MIVCLEVYGYAAAFACGTAFRRMGNRKALHYVGSEVVVVVMAI